MPNVPSEERAQTAIAVIMVLYNHLSEECLRSVLACMDRTLVPVKFIVVDNGSKAFRPEEAVKRLIPEALVYVRGKNYGFGHSNNFGAEQVRAKYYFFLNPDTVLPDPNILNQLHTFMESRWDVGLVTPRQLYPNGELQLTCRRFPSWYMPFFQRTGLRQTAFGRRYLRSFLMHDYDHAAESLIEWVQGSAMFVRGDAWRQLRGFDDRFFMYFEDVDLCRRMHLIGYRIIYKPDSSLIHGHARDSAAEPSIIKSVFSNRVARYHIASWWKYVWKWFRKPVPQLG